MARSHLLRRSLAVVAAFALALPASAGAAVPARAIGDACGGAPEDGFTDTGANGSAQEIAVDCIWWYGVARGLSATRYGTFEHITRGQLATMIAQVMRASETAFSAPTRDHFPDDDGHIHEANIDLVAEHGIVHGFRDGTFRPDATVRRGQMATYLANVLAAIGADLPATGTDHFTDDDGNIHEDHIDLLADHGIATGRSGTRFEPGANLTRGQMAQFNARSLDLLVEQDLVVRPDDADLRITIDDDTVEQTELLTGELRSRHGIANVRLNGCGITDQGLTDQSDTRDGLQFRIPIPGNQEPGPCQLLFSVTTGTGEELEGTRTITVLENRFFVVTLARTSVPAGQALTGSVVPDPDDGAEIESVALDGCGFSGEDVGDTAAAEGVQFSETVPASQPAGGCVLTFTVGYGSLLSSGTLGATETHDVPLTVT